MNETDKLDRCLTALASLSQMLNIPLPPHIHQMYIKEVIDDLGERGPAMTQEIKPCPACREHLQTAYFGNGDYWFSSHADEDTICFLRGVCVYKEHIPQWNALPRHNEPQWLPIKAKAPIKIIRSVWVWADGHNVTHAVFSYGQGRWVHYSHPIEPIDFTPTHYCEHEYVPNPPEEVTK